MKKSEHAKKNIGISPERLAEIKRATLIASTSSSLRLSGSKVTNQEVEQILKEISKSSERK